MVFDSRMNNGIAFSSWITYEARCKGYIRIRVVKKIQVSIQWTCGLWVHHVGWKLEGWWHLAQAWQGGMSMDSLSAMSATMSVPRSGNEENHFSARWTRRTNWQSSHPYVVTGMSSIIETGSYRQSDTTRCLPKQGIISAQLRQITGKVKQKNEKKTWLSD